jgi:PKD repeat protein
VADFTTDKTEYTAGETIHFTNTSENGDSYLWTDPNGKTFTTENLDYTIDINEHSGIKTFKLDVFSKNKKKTSTVLKNINFKQGILPTDFWSIKINSTEYPFVPVFKKSFVENSMWFISCKAAEAFNTPTIQIYLPTNSAPLTSTTYNLRADKNLLANEAYIEIHLEHEPYLFYFSQSGQLNISITNNGSVRVTFNNVPAKWSNNNLNNYNISGDITCE